uniref:Uncharacterized protein n=1 Tax=Anguilla anguilla TaxID=7936 RepID=A0A0E9QJ19_ANGAN
MTVDSSFVLLFINTIILHCHTLSSNRLRGDKLILGLR